VVEAPDRWVLPEDTTGALYNLERDPGETHNLAEEKPEALALCQSRWNEWMTDMANSEVRGPYFKTYFRVLGF